jgi:hypothetical protein
MDVQVRRFGALTLVEPTTDETRRALEAGAPPEAMWWAGCLVIEPRYLPGVLSRLQDYEKAGAL